MLSKNGLNCKEYQDVTSKTSHLSRQIGGHSDIQKKE